MNTKVEAARLKAAQENGDILALRALDRAREYAYSRGFTRTRVPSAARKARELSRQSEQSILGDPVASPGPGWADVGSGSRPSCRDPHPLGEILVRLVRDKGWGSHLEVASVSTRWPQIVGEDVAKHVKVESYDGSVLTLRTSSTAWEVQIRSLLAVLEAKIATEVGSEAVKEIVVLGPPRPSWKHGPWSVPGRGPRDTYG